MNGGLSGRVTWLASCVWILFMAVVGYLGNLSYQRPISGIAMLFSVICVIGVLILVGLADWN